MKNKRQPKVYLPNIGSGHDFSDAERFGTLVPVTEGWVNPFETGVLMRKWKVVLANSHENDYIVVTSLPIICMIGASLFVQKHGRLNLLVYSQQGSYRKRTILMNGGI